MTKLIGKHDLAEVYCQDAMTTLADATTHPRSAALVFLDPPFNIGEPYDGCEDSWTPTEYRVMLWNWLTAATTTLKPNGSLWLNLPDEHVATAVTHCIDELGWKLENWCIWHYRFGQHQPNRFIKSKSHAIWLSCNGSPIVNPEAALVPSLRMSQYNDPRIYDSARSGMRMELDVWGFDKFWGRVQGNNTERRYGHPNQLPELYLKRVIGVSSNPGDLVVDPFAGSGTAAVVANAMGRRCVTGDISKRSAQSTLRRLKEGMVRNDTS